MPAPVNRPSIETAAEELYEAVDRALHPHMPIAEAYDALRAALAKFKKDTAR